MSSTMKLEDISHVQTREKVRKLGKIFPLSSVAVHLDALSKTAGNMNRTCHILAQKENGLSYHDDFDDNNVKADHEEDLQSNAEGLAIGHTIAQSAKLNNASLTNFIPQLNGTSISCTNFEVTLPGSVRLVDLRESKVGTFEIPPGTIFSFTKSENTRGDGPLTSNSLWDEKVEHSQPTKQTRFFPEVPRSDKMISTPISPLIEMTDVNTVGSRDSQAQQIWENWENWENWSDRGGTSSTGKTSWFAQPIRSASIFQQPSTLSALEKKSLEFCAKAILDRAFSQQTHLMDMDWETDSDSNCSCSTCVESRPGHAKKFKAFGMGRRLFRSRRRLSPVTKLDYIGTNRAEYIPAPWPDPDEGKKGNIFHFLNASPPFTNYSSEELRLGDYLRGRIKASHQFSLFRKLPVEVRFMIWQFALEPRMVEIRYDGELSRTWSTCARPTIMRVCRESRQAVSNDYQLSFAVGKSPATILFNFDRDTLYLTFEKKNEAEAPYLVEELMEAIGENTRSQVRSLAIHNNLWSVWTDTFEYDDEMYDEDPDDEAMPQVSVLPRFDNLFQFTLVEDDEIGNWDAEDPGAEDTDAEDSDMYDSPAEKLANSNAIWQPVAAHSFCETQMDEMYVKEILLKTAFCTPSFSIPSLKYQKRIKDPKAKEGSQRKAR